MAPALRPAALDSSVAHSTSQAQQAAAWAANTEAAEEVNGATSLLCVGTTAG